MDSVITREDKENLKNINPTLLVGLGGTGWEILTRVKERLGYYIGGLHYYSCLNFLHIDTDKPRLGGWQDDSQTQHIHACNGAESLFNDNDSYGIRKWLPARSTETIHSFDTGAGQVRPFGRLAFFANYDSSGIQKAIEDAFNNIRKKDASERLKESPKYKQLEATTRIQMDTGGVTDVIVVASIAGGTGSGMFFDAVTALRKKMNNKGMIYAYLIFPDHYRDVGNIESMRANGYAFLKELEYFQHKNTTHRLEAFWPGDRTPDVHIQATLCDRVYLYSHTDELRRVTQKEEVFDSIAESIFKDFTFGGFADEKRSSENNENRDLDTLYRPDPVKDAWGISIQSSFTRHFQSLGYASLGMPHDQLIEACAYRLAAQVVKSWHPDSVQGGASSGMVGDVLQDSGMLIEAGNVGSANKTDRKIEVSNTKAWCEKLKKRDESVGWLLTRLLNKLDTSQHSELCLIDAEHADQGMGVKDGGSRDMAAQIESAVTACEEGLKKRLDTHFRNMSAQIFPELKSRLESWCRNRVMGKGEAAAEGEEISSSTRLNFTDLVMVIEEMKGQLEQQIASLEGPVSQKLQTRYEDQKKRYDDALQKLREYHEDAKLGLFKRLEKGLGILDTKAQRNALAANVCDFSFGSLNEIGYLECAVYKRVAQAAAALLRQMIGFAENLRADYSFDPDRLSNAIRYLNSRSEIASNVRSSQHVRSLFTGGGADSIDKVYAKALQRYHAKSDVGYEPDPSLSPEVNEQNFCARDILNISRRFVEEIGDMGKIRQALHNGFSDAKSLSAENAEWVRKLLSITQEPFRKELPNVCSFWSRFAEAYSTDKQREDAILELFEASAYWLNMNHNFDFNSLRHGGTEQATYVLAGLPAIPKGVDGQERNRIEGLKAMVQSKIEALAGDQKLTIKDLPTCDELIVYRRSIALPLCYSEELADMKAAYNEVRASGKPLHITKNDRIFTDISLLTPQMASANTKSIRTATLALLFDIIKVTQRPKKPGDETLSFEYTYIKPGMGASVNYLGQCCVTREGCDGVREVAEQLQKRGKSDIVETISMQVEKYYQAVFQAEDKAEALKYWVVLCQKLVDDLPKVRDDAGQMVAVSGREVEYAVCLYMMNQAMNELRALPGWKEEQDCAFGEKNSEVLLMELTQEQGDKLFPKRSEDGFRTWNVNWRQAK